MKEMDTVEDDMPKSKVAWVNVIASGCEDHEYVSRWTAHEGSTSEAPVGTRKRSTSFERAR